VTIRFSAFAAYLTGLGTWFIPFGIQMVLFPWLVAVVLHMDAFAVGVAQMALMAPSLLFLPLGGLAADRGNPRKLLLRYHVLYAIPPLVLAGVLAMGGLSYPLLIAYGVAAGSISESSVGGASTPGKFPTTSPPRPIRKPANAKAINQSAR